MTLTAKQAAMLSVAEVRERCRDEWEDELNELDRWYESGKQLTAGPNGDLMRKEAEANEDWLQRVARMANLNVLARIVDAVGGWIYSSSPKRSLGLSEGDAAQEVLEDQMRRMRMRAIEREAGSGQVLRGAAVIAFGWRAARGRGDKGSITARTMRAQDVYTEYAPDDPSHATLRVFRVANEGEDANEHPYWYRCWTDANYFSVDSDWRPVPLGDMEPSGRNPFGMIPATELEGLSVPGTGRCLSLVRDVVGQQKLILNKLSDLDQLVRYQSGDIMVIKDFPSDDRKTTGTTRFIRLSPDPNTDLFFASPSAKITEALEVIKQTVEWSFQTCGLPVTVLIGDQAESGYALRVRYQQAESLVRTYQERNVGGEEHALRVMCAIGRYGGLALPEPWSFEPRVEFSSDIFPADEDARRLADARDVAAGLMTKRDFWRRNRQDIPEDKLDEYAASVAEEESARQAASGAFAFTGAPDAGVAL